MKETKQIWSLCKKSVKWDEKTVRQKLILTWFGLSFVILGVSGGSLVFATLAVANFAASSYYCVNYVPINEED